MHTYDPQSFLCYGEDVFISDQAIIKHPHLCRIGNHVAIDSVTFSTAVHIGDYIHVAPYVCAIGGKNSTVILEDFAFVAAGTKIVAGSDDYTGMGIVGAVVPMEYRQVTFSSVTLKKFSGCGVNCTILPGVTIGEGAVLGANSLAITDLEPWTIYVGSPARPIKIRKKETIYGYAKKLGY